jgi:glutamyl-tRNA reductase
LRERFAFDEARIPAALRLLRDSGSAEEAVILSTCNRVEIYAASSGETRQVFEALRQFLLTSHDYSEPLTDELYALTEPQSVQHLFRVACGLDSMVLGETEILGQLKKAYEVALRDGHTGAILNRTFQQAFNAAKYVRTHTNIQRGNVSVASVAVELAERIFSDLAERKVLVVGAGETGEKTARALVTRGAGGLLVSNRSPEKAEAVASELGGRAVPFEEWLRECAGVDIVIGCVSAGGYVLDRTKLAPLMKTRRNRPILLIDIAVPRGIEPEANLMPNVYLYNIDDLQAISDQARAQREEEIARCEQIIREKAAALLDRRPRLDGQPDVRPAFRPQ